MRIARKQLPQGIVPKPLNKNKGPVLTILRNQSQLHPTSIGSTEESAFCKKGTSSVSCEACTSNVIRLAQVESLSIKNGHLSGIPYLSIVPVPSPTWNTVVVKRFKVLWAWECCWPHAAVHQRLLVAQSPKWQNSQKKVDMRILYDCSSNQGRHVKVSSSANWVSLHLWSKNSQEKTTSPKQHGTTKQELL